MKTKNKKGISLIDLMFVVLITGIIFTYGFNRAYTFYTNVREKAASNQIRDQINEVITADDVGRGISETRIKSNTLIFKNGTNKVNNYYYNEVYKIDPITQLVSSIPETQFYGMEELQFPSDLIFEFDNTIEGITLQTDGLDNNAVYLGINRVMPNNDLMVFDAGASFFQQVTEDRKRTFRSDFTYGKGYKTLFIGDAISDTNYQDIIKGAVPPTFNKVQIKVIFRKKHIGDIVFDKETKKLVYVDKRSENVTN